MHYRRLITLAVATFALAPLAACGSSVKAQRYDDLVSNVDQERTIWPKGDLLTACGLDHSRTYFIPNSSELTSDDQEQLGQIGRCLTTGRLANRSVLVTGFTDSDGTAEDNLQLGLARGLSVASELASRGVHQSRIYVRSRGQDRATGETTAGRALDRRVELALLNE